MEQTHTQTLVSNIVTREHKAKWTERTCNINADHGAVEECVCMYVREEEREKGVPKEGKHHVPCLPSSAAVSVLGV